MKTTAIVAAALLLGACAKKEYVYNWPTTPAGQACVGPCQAAQDTCEAGQYRLAQDEMADCHKALERRWQRCETERQRRPDKLMEECAPRSWKKSGQECEVTPEYSLCEKEFRSCFEDCGGTVHVRN